MNKHQEVFERIAAESRTDYKVEVRVDKSDQPYFYNSTEKGEVCTWARDYFDIKDARNLRSFILEVKDDLEFHTVLVGELERGEAHALFVAQRS